MSAILIFIYGSSPNELQPVYNRTARQARSSVFRNKKDNGWRKFLDHCLSGGPQGLLSIQHSITCSNIYKKVWD